MKELIFYSLCSDAELLGGCGMTNFEKWKQSLTVEQFVDIHINCGVIKCPLEDDCDGSLETEDCYAILTKWANKECEE